MSDGQGEVGGGGAPSPALDDDAKRLAELGYRQDLSRTWSGFSNFAISFSIISILAGCFTTFGQAWNNGGPIAMSIGWPVISAFILVIGLSMSELVSAYPTSGGIYYWAAKLGSPKTCYYTGWLNLIGNVAVLASVAYGCATFTDLTLSTYSESYAEGYSLTRVFGIFVGVLVLVAVVNIFRSHLLAVINNISVWWHVLGAAAVVLILVLLPKSHQSPAWVFTTRINNSGYSESLFWFLVLPLGFLLTQYTITGYDASAHLSEETHQAAAKAARGIWQSIFYSAIGGWILLLSFLFAVQDEAGVTAAGGAVSSIFTQALTSGWAAVVLGISALGQLFCSMASMTSSSRMIYAFSRDGAVPASSRWSTLSSRKVPANAVLFAATIAFVITLPALARVDINGAPVPVAFYAVVSIAVVGLYLSFLIPIWLRLRAGDRFTAGPWTLGRKHVWMGWVAVIEIVVISVFALLPVTPNGIPFTESFGLEYVNYAPIVTGGTLLGLWIAWHVSVKSWFTGPRTTVDEVPTAPSA